MIKKTKLSIEDVFYQKLDQEHPAGPKNSCLSWFGGKYEMRERLAALSPPDILIDNYIEVFAGAGHTIFYKHPAANKNVLNDINKGIYTLFKVIKDNEKFEILAQKLCQTPYDKEVWKSCLNWNERTDEIELAWAFLVRHLQAINVCGGWAKPKEIRGKGKDIHYHNVRKFRNKTGKYLRELKEKMEYITVENNDFIDCINKHDSEKSFFLLDPPYVLDTRTAKSVYDHEMSNEQHERLVERLMTLKGFALLCGYDNDIYKQLEEHGYTKILIKRVKRSSSNTNRNDIKNEYIWVNYPIYNGILSYFVHEEAIFSFSKFGENIKNGHFKYEEVPECHDIIFKNKNSNINATQTKIRNLEKKQSIKLPDAYKRALTEFNGGYFDIELSNKTSLKPKYLFGILNQEHSLDLETNITRHPQLKEKGYIPIGNTTNNDLICLKTTNPLDDIFGFKYYEDDCDEQNLPGLVLYKTTGEVIYLDENFEGLLSNLFAEYRGY